MIDYSGYAIPEETMLALYAAMLKPRMIEEKMLILLRQGRVSKWFSGIGQEAISIGAVLAMDSDEYIMPLHRNLGIFTGRHMSFTDLFLQWQGKQSGFSKGRERSFHFGSNKHHICGMISHLGPQLAIADGIALAHKLAKEEKVSLAFSGDGGTSEGDFHEALNVAAVWGLPVIFLIENNGYGLSTPIAEQFVCEHLVDKAKGYGMRGVRIDGNNVLEVYQTIAAARAYCIKEQKPILIEAMTFRMRGHEEASGVKYVPKELFEQWAAKDPLLNFETWLKEQKILTDSHIQAYREDIADEIEQGLKVGFDTPAPIADTAVELADVYAPCQVADTEPRGGAKQDMKLIQAITNALDMALAQHPKLVFMGQDIAGYGGAFKVTEGLAAKYGFDRVRNTPLCESAIVGTALGLSIKGYKAMMEMQFSDFVSVGFNQIVNNLAKIHYRWGQNADVVVRMPTGAGVGAGPFHSQSTEAWFTHCPGLKVVYPSSPADAKGLLLAAFEDPNPVLFFEHKALYRSIAEPVPTEYYTIPFGKARVVQHGEDCSIITYGAGVHWAMEYAGQHPDLNIEIVDLRTLLPLDYDAIRTTVERTNRVLILHEDTLYGGIGGELAAWIGEHLYHQLDAPVLRCASLDTPIPFARELEENFLAKSELHGQISKLLAF